MTIWLPVARTKRNGAIVVLFVCLSLVACLHGCSADADHAVNCDNLLAKAKSLAAAKDYKQEQQCLTEFVDFESDCKLPKMNRKNLKAMMFCNIAPKFPVTLARGTPTERRRDRLHA
jgi:hypothetical protein